MFINRVQRKLSCNVSSHSENDNDDIDELLPKRAVYSLKQKSEVDLPVTKLKAA